MDNLTIDNAGELDNFIKNYRDSLGAQKESAIKALDQQRDNDFTTIMSKANTAGMLYSNLPEREKTKYQAQTYLPSYTKIGQAYQTGLDTLRANQVKYQNSIKAIQEAIGDLNKDYIISQNAY